MSHSQVRLSLTLWVLVAGLISVDQAGAQSMYKCTGQNGRTSYQEAPCQDGSGSAIKVSPSSAAPVDEPGNKVANEAVRRLESWQRNNRKTDLESKIQQEEQNVRRYQESMDSELAHLQRESLRANNNLAGAIYDQAQSSKMQAISTKYRSKTDQSNENLKQYRKELSELQSK